MATVPNRAIFFTAWTDPTTSEFFPVSTNALITDQPQLDRIVSAQVAWLDPTFNPASPGPIGGNTPSTGAFTALTANSIRASGALETYTNDILRGIVTATGTYGFGTSSPGDTRAVISGTNAGLDAGSVSEVFRVGDGRGGNASDGLRLTAVRETTAANEGEWTTQLWRLERNVDGAAFPAGIDFSTSGLVLRSGGARRITINDTTGTTGGSGSAGAGNQYVEMSFLGVRYKLLHDGVIS